MAENAVNTEQGVILEALNNKVDLNQLNTDNQGLSYVSGLGMPSDKYINLTRGASGTEYTAPANGWFVCYIGGLTTVGYLYMRNNANQLIMETRSTINGTAVSAYVPVQKGQSILINYDAVGSVNIFRFIYTQGESEE